MTIRIGVPNLHADLMSFNLVPEVKRTQRTLLFLIFVVLGISIISFMSIIYSLSIKYRTNTYEPIIILCWILFFACGMFVTQRYYSMGLFVFAWLGIINIILTCILIVLVTVGIVIVTSDSSKQSSEIPFTLILIVAGLTSVILDAVIIIFSFKLSYLIMKNTRPNDHERS
ncbi:unnamed protein product [Rotaria magnacalcarata]|uniref:Uncharacterized protein n=1 Tax=Rotaria magnacalcarata TaxID=392030 RepID=A0A816TUD2_9BILA|nr:unnamed protein product [Rotaria magnacalcarata]CAF1683305.1 unnamed protein product [Rotaria magnacalcarata]CAF2100844.1 unnamed protein product [Rotaria magnacalcarata]CAF3987218.1 unnamed protein product [Rotaria magnacalcarata]CAF4077695.1 unnamed protein product [Rotaria magnacalcarata]